MMNFAAIRDRILESRTDHANGKLSKLDLAARLFESHQVLLEYSKLLNDTSLKAIEISLDNVYVVSKYGARFEIDFEDSRSMGLECLNFGSFEGVDEDQIIDIARGCTTFVDIGANIGWYSIHTAILNPSADIWAFEPMFENYNRLASNSAANNVSKNLVLNKFALDDCCGTRDIYVNQGEKGATSFYNIRKLDNPVTRSIPTRTLDFLNIPVSPRTLIKIDAEGAEHKIIQGALDFISSRRPVIVCEILRKWSMEAGVHFMTIPNLLFSFNYQMYCGSKEGLELVNSISEETSQTNFFFIPKELQVGKSSSFSWG
jgi:FkbM family methyltransferase